MKLIGMLQPPDLVYCFVYIKLLFSVWAIRQITLHVVSNVKMWTLLKLVCSIRIFTNCLNVDKPIQKKQQTFDLKFPHRRIDTRTHNGRANQVSTCVVKYCIYFAIYCLAFCPWASNGCAYDNEQVVPYLCRKNFLKFDRKVLFQIMCKKKENFNSLSKTKKGRPNIPNFILFPHDHPNLK